MLKIKTYLGQSKLHGIGIFAGEHIPKGKMVWEYCSLVDITYSKKDWEKLRETLHPESFERIQNYIYKEKDRYIMCTDTAQFMNHSSDASNISDSPDFTTMFASRDIQKGEEILCNYFIYSDEDDHHRPYLK